MQIHRIIRELLFVVFGCRSMHHLLICCVLTLWALVNPTLSYAQKDSEKLGMAMEYMQSNKFHEALIILCQLDKKHTLSPRLKAYIGLCYYYEQDHAMTCKTLDSLLIKLATLAPQERSLYNYCTAESHFYLGEYQEAITYYIAMLDLCHDNEKADALFHLAFCYLNTGDNERALHTFQESLSCYEEYGYPQEKTARIVELKNIIKGLDKPT